MDQRKIVRALAARLAEYIAAPRNAEAMRLHYAVNDLKGDRPVVLVDELPWHEMNHDGSLTLLCEDEGYRAIEGRLRRLLYQLKYFPADLYVPPFYGVRKHIHNTGIGITVDENTLAIDRTNHIISHEYHDKLADEEALARLHPPKITYDKEGTLAEWEFVSDAIGDILPVRLTGVDVAYIVTWDDISRYRGVTNLLEDLIERPEFSHQVIDTLTSFKEAELRQYEELGLLDPYPSLLHCTTALNHTLPGEDFTGHAQLKHIWGRGAAQIFSSVSKRMHDEFDIEYMKRTIGKCGLVYYGCCEALDKKIDIVEKIPNLRKIGVTPWANPEVCGEAIGRKYVFASKPNPASVAVPELDEAELRKEIGRILKAVRQNNCSCDIVLKDISTCCYNPKNIFRWAQIVQEMAME